MNILLNAASLKILFYIALSILIAIIVNAILRSLIKLPSRLQNRRGRTYISIIRNTISVVVYLLALHVIFGLLSINIAPLLASAGIVGLSIGLGAKPLIEDVIAGMMLLSQDSLAIGDRVEIEGSIGRIESIGLTTLTIRAEDGSLHIIPNGMIKKIINFSRKSHLSKTQSQHSGNK